MPNEKEKNFELKKIWKNIRKSVSISKIWSFTQQTSFLKYEDSHEKSEP